MKEFFEGANKETFFRGDKIDLLDCIYFIQSGYVALWCIGKTGKKLLLILKPGEIFPWPKQTRVLKSGEELYYRPVTTLTLLKIKEDKFEKRAFANTKAARQVYVESQLMNNMLLTRCANLASKNAQAKLVARLKFFAERFGYQEANKIIIDLPLTYSDVAASVGTTRETVNREMAKLQRNGIIEMRGQVIVINDLNKLK